MPPNERLPFPYYNLWTKLYGIFREFAAKGKEYDYKMDMTTLKHFSEREFIEALTYIDVLPEWYEYL